MATFRFEQGEAWANATVEQLDALLRQTGQEIGEIAQTSEARGGRLPVDQSQLRNSFVAGVNSEQFSGPEVADIAFAGASAEAGDTLVMGWTADHALRQNYGFVGEDKLGRTYNQSGKFFVEAALAQGQAIVDRLASVLFR